MKNNSFKTCIYLIVSLFVLVSCGKNSNDPLQMVNSHIIVGELDMELISSSGKVIARSTSTSDTEKIYKYLSRGSYFIKIYGFAGALGNYKLVTF